MISPPFNLVSFSSSNCRALQVLVLAAAVLLYCHRLPACTFSRTHKVWIGALTAPNAISIYILAAEKKRKKEEAAG